MGQVLKGPVCSTVPAPVGEERGYSDGPTPMHDLAVSHYLYGCLVFLHRPFPPCTSHSCLLTGCVPEVNNRLTLGLFHNPYAPAPSCSAFLGTQVPVHMAATEIVSLISFRLLQISCFTQPQMFLVCPKLMPPYVGIGPCFSFPHPPRVHSVL